MRRRRTAPNPPHDAYTIPVCGYRTQITIPPEHGSHGIHIFIKHHRNFLRQHVTKNTASHRCNKAEQDRKHIPVAGITVDRRYHTGHRERSKPCRIGNAISKKDKFPSPAGSPEIPETDTHRCRRHEREYNPIRPAQGKRRKYTRQHIAEDTASHCRHHRQERNAENIHSPCQSYSRSGKSKCHKSPVFQKPPTLKTYRTLSYYICSTEAIRRIVVPV